MESKKQWIDVPGGWRYGWPKLWDSSIDPPINEWLKQNGYEEEPAWIRSWYEEQK